MSNQPVEWAYNNLTISTLTNEKKDALDLFYLQEELVDLDDKSKLTFFTHSPIPTMLIETAGENDEFTMSQNIEMTGYATLHEYTIKNWGCPTDAIDVEFSQVNEYAINYEFRTRSCSPLKWMKEVSEQYPTLMFEIEGTNEFELWDEFNMVLIDGKEVVMEYKKKQR